MDKSSSTRSGAASRNRASASSARRKRVLLNSRLDVTRQLGTLVARLDRRPAVLVNASAVGFYGSRDHAGEIDETAAPQPGQFQSDLCALWEAEAETVRCRGVRVVRLRFGGVIGRSGGLYPPLAAASRLGLGAVLGSGMQPMPWIHLDDAVAAIRFVIAQSVVDGAVNIVAPEFVSQAGFAVALAQACRRAVRLHIPAAAIRGLAGEAATILLDGQAAAPRALLGAGSRFRHPTLASALADLTNRKQAAHSAINRTSAEA